jgi:hypothetical protein
MSDSRPPKEEKKREEKSEPQEIKEFTLTSAQIDVLDGFFGFEQAKLGNYSESLLKATLNPLTKICLLQLAILYKPDEFLPFLRHCLQGKKRLLSTDYANVLNAYKAFNEIYFNNCPNYKYIAATVMGGYTRLAGKQKDALQRYGLTGLVVEAKEANQDILTAPVGLAEACAEYIKLAVDQGIELLKVQYIELLKTQYTQEIKEKKLNLEPAMLIDEKKRAEVFSIVNKLELAKKENWEEIYLIDLASKTQELIAENKKEKYSFNEESDEDSHREAERDVPIVIPVDEVRQFIENAREGFDMSTWPSDAGNRMWQPDDQFITHLQQDILLQKLYIEYPVERLIQMNDDQRVNLERCTKAIIIAHARGIDLNNMLLVDFGFRSQRDIDSDDLEEIQEAMGSAVVSNYLINSDQVNQGGLQEILRSYDSDSADERDDNRPLDPSQHSRRPGRQS